MPNPLKTIETTGVEIEEPDTEAEFRSLFTDADEGRLRFEALAKSADTSGQPEIAKVYREIGGTVMTLMADFAAATGGALTNLEEEVDDLPSGGGGPGAEASGLLQEDAEKYLQLFEQYIRMLDGLDAVIPSGSEGDPQREIFATLRRMTEGMAEFTRSIIMEEETEDEPEDEDEPEEETPDA